MESLALTFSSGWASGINAYLVVLVLGVADRADSASYASGLVIGCDARVGLRVDRDAAGAEEIIVVGRPELTSLYAHAIGLAGRNTREVDGERAFVAGTRAIAAALA